MRLALDAAYMASPDVRVPRKGAAILVAPCQGGGTVTAMVGIGVYLGGFYMFFNVFFLLFTTGYIQD